MCSISSKVGGKQASRVSKRVSRHSKTAQASGDHDDEYEDRIGLIWFANRNSKQTERDAFSPADDAYCTIEPVR